jgi:hypothetical protein
MMMSRVEKAGALAVLALSAASCVNSSFFFNPPRGAVDTLDGSAPAVDNDCATVMLVQMIDGCTGGRGYLNGHTTPIRRN